MLLQKKFELNCAQTSRRHEELIDENLRRSSSENVYFDPKAQKTWPTCFVELDISTWSSSLEFLCTNLYQQNVTTNSPIQSALNPFIMVNFLFITLKRHFKPCFWFERL